MFFDQQASATTADDFFVGGPEFTFSDLPKQASSIKETIILEGSNTGGTITLGGNVDE